MARKIRAIARSTNRHEPARAGSPRRSMSRRAAVHLAAQLFGLIQRADLTAARACGGGGYFTLALVCRCGLAGLAGFEGRVVRGRSLGRGERRRRARAGGLDDLGIAEVASGGGGSDKLLAAWNFIQAIVVPFILAGVQCVLRRRQNSLGLRR